jgi:hypothetical protein
MALATVHFAAAAFISQTLEIDDANRRILQREVKYTPFQVPGPAATTLGVKDLIVLFLALTGAFHMLYALAGRWSAALRFVEYSITASIMIVIILLLSGEDNGDLILACAALIASTMFFGILQDDKLRIRSLGGKAFWLGWIPFLVAWFFVIKLPVHGVWQ